MSLDKQLREVLSEEGDSRTPPLPDLDRLISGGRTRRRRRTVARVSVSLAAVVLVGASAYGATRVDLGRAGERPDPAITPSDVTEPWDRTPIEPGLRTLLAGTTGLGERIEAEITLEGSGWFTADQPLLLDGTRAAGTGVYRPEEVANGTGCSEEWAGRLASRKSRGLARQLTRLPNGTVLQQPTPTRMLGHDALHLSMQIDTSCPAPSYYSVARSVTVERGISYTEPPTDVVIEFWVVDLDGTPVVVDLWHEVDAPQELVDRASNARESITFLPVE